MSSKIHSSGLTSIGIPGAQIVVTIGGPNDVYVYLKTSKGNDPSPTEPLYTAMRTAGGGGSIYEGRIIAAPLSMHFSGSFGVANDTPFRVWVVLIDDNGTFRLGVICCSQSNRIFPLDEERLIDSPGGVTIGPGIFYCNVGAPISARSFKVVGYFTFNAGIGAGGWSAAPDVIQMFGPGIKLPGEVVQSNALFTNTGYDINTGIPFDNTKPQSNEGDALFAALSFTARSPANWIKHDFTVRYVTSSDSPSARCIVALFKDSDTDAFVSAAKATPLSSTDEIRILTRILAGTQATQFYARLGVDTSFSSSPIIVNKTTQAGNTLGLTTYSGYEVTEYMG